MVSCSTSHTHTHTQTHTHTHTYIYIYMLYEFICRCWHAWNSECFVFEIDRNMKLMKIQENE